MAEKKSIKQSIIELFTKHKIDGKEIFGEETPTVKFISAETEDGKTIYTTSEEWKVGVPCFEDEAGTKPCPDGNYKMKSGETVVVKDGNITEIMAAEEEMSPEQVEQAMEKLAAKLEEISTAHETTKTELASFKEKFTASEKKVVELTTENKTLKAQSVQSPKDTVKKDKFEKPKSNLPLTHMERVRIAREKALSN